MKSWFEEIISEIKSLPSLVREIKFCKKEQLFSSSYLVFFICGFFVIFFAFINYLIFPIMRFLLGI